MRLNELRDNPGARPTSKRVGRGIGSGKGKTSGRGVKGQKARTGVSLAGFEGGQNPLYRRLPKRGFNNAMFATIMAEVNLDKLQAAVDAGLIDAKKDVTIDDLKAANLIGGRFDGVKVLGKGSLKVALKLHVTAASASAKAAVEKAGGQITLPA
ncbi:MAG: 50S ribosomal protein L15 [Holosporales bacterium]